MAGRLTLRKAALISSSMALAFSGCSSSRSRGTANTTTASTAPTASSTTLARLSGTHSIDITWSASPQPGTACPAGLTGSCTLIHASGSDATLGSLELQEYLATPTDSSCSTGNVAGTFSMSDAAGSSMSYTGTGQFCWDTTTGSFNLTMTKGTGQLAGTTGTLVAKITSNPSLHDEWTGELTFR